MLSLLEQDALGIASSSSARLRIYPDSLESAERAMVRELAAVRGAPAPKPWGVGLADNRAEWGDFSRKLAQPLPGTAAKHKLINTSDLSVSSPDRGLNAAIVNQSDDDEYGDRAVDADDDDGDLGILNDLADDDIDDEEDAGDGSVVDMDGHSDSFLEPPNGGHHGGGAHVPPFGSAAAPPWASGSNGVSPVMNATALLGNESSIDMDEGCEEEGDELNQAISDGALISRAAGATTVMASAGASLNDAADVNVDHDIELGDEDNEGITNDDAEDADAVVAQLQELERRDSISSDDLAAIRAALAEDGFDDDELDGLVG